MLRIVDKFQKSGSGSYLNPECRFYRIVCNIPPSITVLPPVKKLALSDARKDTKSAISSGLPNLPIGILFRDSFITTSSSFDSLVERDSNWEANCSVSTGPNMTLLTVMLNGANSLDNDLK